MRCICHKNLQRKIETIKYLVEKGANVNFQDNTGWTPLLWSVGTFYSGSEIPKYFIKNGADITIKSIHNDICLSHRKDIWSNYEMQKLILSKNPRWIGEFSKHNIPLHKWIKEEYPEDAVSSELGFFQ